MVFLIQNTQNRESAAIQLKLDEMIRATQGAHNALLDLEKLSAKDLEEIRGLYERLAEQARRTKKQLGRHRHAEGEAPVASACHLVLALFTGLRSLVAGPFRTFPNLSNREP